MLIIKDNITLDIQRVKTLQGYRKFKIVLFVNGVLKDSKTLRFNNQLRIIVETAIKQGYLI